MAKKPPTEKTVRATLAKLLREVAAVYHDEAELTKTSHLGTIVVQWESGRAVLNRKPTDEGANQ